MTTSKPSLQGIGGLKNGAFIGGIQISEVNGIANSTTPNRIGDLLVDFAAGKLYIAGGVSASSDWKLVTSA